MGGADARADESTSNARNLMLWGEERHKRNGEKESHTKKKERETTEKAGYRASLPKSAYAGL